MIANCIVCLKLHCFKCDRWLVGSCVKPSSCFVMLVTSLKIMGLKMSNRVCWHWEWLKKSQKSRVRFGAWHSRQAIMRMDELQDQGQHSSCQPKVFGFFIHSFFMHYIRWRRHCPWQFLKYWSALSFAVFLAIRLVTYCFIKLLSLFRIRLGHCIDKRLWVLLAPILGNIKFDRLEGGLGLIN